MTSTTKLLSVASPALMLSGSATDRHPAVRTYGSLGEELALFLAQKNGFFAFESALHVFPFGAFQSEMTIEEWNRPDLWRHEYGDLADDKLFFAEDVFGGQFCLSAGRVCSFEPETGEVKPIAEAIEDWCKIILADYEFMTGFPLAHEWQKRHGRLMSGTRLVPKRPFVLGGQYAIENLCAMDAIRGMRARGNLARQLKDVPDGAEIEFEIVE